MDFHAIFSGFVSQRFELFLRGTVGLVAVLLLVRATHLDHGSRITSNGIWALVITGNILVITGNGDY